MIARSCFIGMIVVFATVAVYSLAPLPAAGTEATAPAREIFSLCGLVHEEHECVQGDVCTNNPPGYVPIIACAVNADGTCVNPGLQCGVNYAPAFNHVECKDWGDPGDWCYEEPRVCQLGMVHVCKQLKIGEDPITGDPQFSDCDCHEDFVGEFGWRIDCVQVE